MRRARLVGEVSLAATWVGLVLEVSEGMVGFSVHTLVSVSLGGCSFLRPHRLLLVTRWSTCTRWSTRLSISSLARSEYWWSEPAGGGLSVCPACSLPDAHALILFQAGQAALLSAGTWGRWGCQLRGPPGGGGPGEIAWVCGHCLLCTCRALLLSSVSPQFLSLDDLPDSRANVDLRNDLTPRVSPPPSVGAAFS